MVVGTSAEATTLGALARVRLVKDGGRLLHLELRDGRMYSVYREAPYEFAAGSVVLVWGEGSDIEAAPGELWPEESWVGVVRLKLQDTTVVDQAGRCRLVPTSEAVAYAEGNTVEVRDTCGVVRVLSPDPIKLHDLPAIDDAAIAKFRTRRGAQRETFEDFGGLEEVVERAKELIEVSLNKRKGLLEMGIDPVKGVLFTGPPGTGKTMLARIIANTTKSRFYHISGPEVFSMWYGQSGEILRKLFADAGRRRQAIIFFDEIDSVAAQRSDWSHEETRRVVAQLLSLMDGFKPNKNVVVIAATNRPQDVDAALRRPGRFDWEIHFRLPNRHDRQMILQVRARRLKTVGTMPHERVADKTEGWSGAELAAIWSEAGLLAAKDGRLQIMAEDYVGGFERVSEQRRRARQASAGGGS